MVRSSFLAWLTAVLVIAAAAGCSVQRAPLATVTPTFTYRDADPRADVAALFEPATGAVAGVALGE